MINRIPADSTRILLLSLVGDNRWSGMGKWTHSIAHELRKRGVEVETLFADDFPSVRRSGRLAFLFVPPLVALRLWRDHGKYDFVVVHEPSGFWYGCLRRVFASLPPMIVMSHGVESRAFRLLLRASRNGRASVNRGSRWKTPLLRLWQSDGSLRLSDHVICLSTFDREYLINDLGIAPKRITLMINGVDRDEFSAAPRETGGSSVLFVAGWLPAKGSHTLPKLWRLVRQRHPNATLTLVGTGASAAEVIEAFAPEDRKSINVIPRLTEVEEVVQQFKRHDIFLMPSLNEGSPLALLEALAAGLPVVAGRAGGIPDIVTHEVNGLLFDPLEPADGAEQLNRLLEDAALRRQLSAAALERSAELSWAQAADALLEALENAALRGSKEPVRTDRLNSSSFSSS